MIQSQLSKTEEGIIYTSTIPEPKYASMAARGTSGGTIFGLQKKNYIPSMAMMHVLPTFSIGDWATWPMFPHTTEEIRRRLLYTPIDNTCISYLCRFSSLEPEFFEEFAVLTSGIFHAPNEKDPEMIKKQPITYTPEALDYFIHVFRKQYSEENIQLPEVPESILKDKALYKAIAKKDQHFPSLVTLADRVDWLYLGKFQTWPGKLYAMYYKQFQAFRIFNKGIEEAIARDVEITEKQLQM